MANILSIPGPNSKYSLEEAYPAGFLAGLWHGILLPLTFFISIFYPGVRIYEKSNRGRLYDLGFLFGASCSFGSGGAKAGTMHQ